MVRIQGGGDVSTWAVDAVMLGPDTDAVEVAVLDDDGEPVITGLLTPNRALYLASALIVAARDAGAR